MEVTVEKPKTERELMECILNELIEIKTFFLVQEQKQNDIMKQTQENMELIKDNLPDSVKKVFDILQPNTRTNSVKSKF